MSDTESKGGDNGENGSTVDPTEVVRAYTNSDKTQTEVAEQFDITQQHVSRLVNAYDTGKEEGMSEGYKRAAVDRMTDDPEPEGDPYSTSCPNCGEGIPMPDEPGKHPCPECDATLNWSKVELGY